MNPAFQCSFLVIFLRARKQEVVYRCISIVSGNFLLHLSCSYQSPPSSDNAVDVQPYREARNRMLYVHPLVG